MVPHYAPPVTHTPEGYTVWLSPEEKANELASLLTIIAEGGDAPGSFDPPMLRWVARINRLCGVLTLQSCAGHRRGTTVEAGHLWLRLREWDAHRLDVPALVRAPRMERVEMIYFPDQSERVLPILALTFEGLERHDDLEGALGPLLVVLETASPTSDSCCWPPLTGTRCRARRWSASSSAPHSHWSASLSSSYRSAKRPSLACADIASSIDPPVSSSHRTPSRVWSCVDGLDSGENPQSNRAAISSQDQT